MTRVSLLVIGTLVGVLGYGGLRLVPVYIEYLTLASAMDSVKREFELEELPTSPVSIRNALRRRLRVENVRSVDVGDFVIRAGNGAYEVGLTYEGRTSYLGNISLVVHFDRQIEIAR